MTTITFEETKGYLEINVVGHSGYASAGSDIVCDSISSVMLLTYDLLTSFCKGVIFESKEKKPSMRMLVKSSEESKKIFYSLIWFLQRLENDYPKYVKVKEIK